MCFSTVKDTKHLQHEKQQCSTPSNELLTPNYHQIKAEFLITPCKALDHATHRLAPSVPSNVKYSHASSFAHLTPPPSWLTATRPSSLSSSITTLGEPCLQFLAWLGFSDAPWNGQCLPLSIAHGIQRWDCAFIYVSPAKGRWGLCQSFKKSLQCLIMRYSAKVWINKRYNKFHH